jgi:hypothetical protein
VPKSGAEHRALQSGGGAFLTSLRTAGSFYPVAPVTNQLQSQLQKKEKRGEQQWT